MSINDIIPIGISLIALLVSIITALRLYDRSQRSNAKDVFVYPLIKESGDIESDDHIVCVRNSSQLYPILDIKVYYLGSTKESLKVPILWGDFQQLLPGEEIQLPWRLGGTAQAPITNAHLKGFIDVLTGEYSIYRIACVYSTSSKRRWVKTYDNEFYLFNSPFSYFRGIPKLIRKSRTRSD